MNELERLQTEHEELKTRVDGEFGNESLRKRGRGETSETAPPGDFWAGFEENFKTKGYDLGLL